jgi:hypothetical protein
MLSCVCNRCIRNPFTLAPESHIFKLRRCQCGTVTGMEKKKNLTKVIIIFILSFILLHSHTKIILLDFSNYFRVCCYLHLHHHHLLSQVSFPLALLLNQ